MLNELAEKDELSFFEILIIVLVILVVIFSFGLFIIVLAVIPFNEGSDENVNVDPRGYNWSVISYKEKRD